MMRRIGICLAAVAVLLLTAACQAPAPKEPDLSRLEPLQKVAVLPYQRVLPPDGAGDGGVCCPLTGAAFQSGPIMPGAEDALNTALAGILPRISDLNIVPASRAGLVYDRLLGRVPSADARAEVAETGRKLGADAVIIGFVFRFRDLVGGSMAAETPASVSFNLMVVSSKDGRVIWKGSFEQTQQPLSENLLNLDQYAEHGLKWYTATELSRIGMEQVLRSFPWRKAKAAPGQD